MVPFDLSPRKTQRLDPEFTEQFLCELGQALRSDGALNRFRSDVETNCLPRTLAAMRVLVAFDKFKDSLTAPQACAIAADALRTSHPDWTLDLCPLTDGGEGFGEILTRAANGTMETTTVTGPRGEPVEASIGFTSLGKIPVGARVLLRLDDSEIKKASDARVALVEMAAASGLALLSAERRDPWQTSSIGTGQLLAHAANRGATVIVLGVGGSATNDLGLGALSALGLQSFSADDSALASPIPIHWPQLSRFAGEISPSLPRLRIACDVANPLLGPSGAAATFGPQKGLQSADLSRLENASARIARMLAAQYGQPETLMEIPGAGAAGGIAFGLMTAARAQIVAGFDLVSAWLNLDARIAAADLVLTGEGRFDASSLRGKGPGAIAARARALRKPVHVFAGAVAAFAPGLKLHAITPEGISLADALRATPVNLAAAIQAAV